MTEKNSEKQGISQEQNSSSSLSHLYDNAEAEALRERNWTARQSQREAFMEAYFASDMRYNIK